MTNTSDGGAQPGNFFFVKVNTMGQPGAVVQPAHTFQVVHGAHAEGLQAKVFFIQRFGQMCVQAHILAFSQLSAFLHNFPGDRKWRAGGQSNLNLRAGTALVVLANKALAVANNGFTGLYGVLRWQAAVFFTKTH